MIRAATLLALLSACGGGPEPAHISLDATTAAPVPTGMQRGWRRMDLDQLDASIRKVTGGIGWVDERGVSELDALADTLGAADYLTGKPEDKSVSLLFLKFLEDAAADVCGKLVDREATASDGHVFLVHASLDDTVDSDRAAIEANLSEALLRFHGRVVPPGTAGLEPWVFLFESATLVSNSPRVGWHTVCVGLITHPDFYTY